ncbi:MAG: hypothetical protein P8J50_13010 [Acidimicrobiales bacterium]|nr:hypothetical protein [Acidimicrobiales bacterium]
MVTQPEIAVHYYVAGRPPFLNLSDVADEDVDGVLADLAAEHERGRNRRRFGRLYMELRAEAERRLRDAFTATGGRIERRAPHYFTLGESPWFRQLSPRMESIEILLSDLPADATSITWWDSFAAMAEGEDLGLPVAPAELCRRVHRLDDVAELVEAYGLPASQDEGPSDPMSAQHTFVEIQVWTDEPVLAHLR